jgi:putative ABC transport system permease protein
VFVSVLSLGFGIGATTAVFSFVNAVQFAPLLVSDERSLVGVSETSTTELCKGCSVGTSYPAFLEWRSRATSFASLDGYSEDRFVVSGGTGPERVGGALVSAGLFRTLGVQPTHGRALRDDDDWPASTPVVVIGDTIWRRVSMPIRRSRQDPQGQRRRSSDRRRDASALRVPRVRRVLAAEC